MEWLNREALTAWLLRVTPSLFEWAMILLPLTLYWLWLGFDVGRKKTPYVIGGAWDTLLLVLALSGFLFLGPPTWLISKFAAQGWSTYCIAFASYLGAVALLCLWWILRSRQSLVIYNIDPEVFQGVFRPVLDAMNVKYQMTPGNVAIEGQQLLLSMEPTPAYFCVTMNWVGDQTLWGKLSKELRAALCNVQTVRNPAGATIPLYAAVLLCFISLSTVLFVWYLAFIF